MGEVVGAGLTAHVPTIVLPEEIRRELNNGDDTTLVAGLQQLRKDVFETLDYDTVVVLDSHWATTVEFVVTAHERRKGLFTSEELPRGMSQRPYEFLGDPELGIWVPEGMRDTARLPHELTRSGLDDVVADLRTQPAGEDEGKLVFALVDVEGRGEGAWRDGVLDEAERAGGVLGTEEVSRAETGKSARSPSSGPIVCGAAVAGTRLLSMNVMFSYHD